MTDPRSPFLGRVYLSQLLRISPKECTDEVWLAVCKLFLQRSLRIGVKMSFPKMIVLSIFCCLTFFAQAETPLYMNDFNSSQLAPDLRFVSGDWRAYPGGIVGRATTVDIDGPNRYDCADSGVVSMTGILCRCIANCGNEYRVVSAKVLKRLPTLPTSYFFQTGMNFIRRIQRQPMFSPLGTLLPTTYLSVGQSATMMFDYQNAANYKWVKFSGAVAYSPDGRLTAQHLYCEPGETVSGVSTAIPNKRKICANLGVANGVGIAQISLSVRSRNIRVFINGQLANQHSYATPINEKAMGLSVDDRGAEVPIHYFNVIAE